MKHTLVRKDTGAELYRGTELLITWDKSETEDYITDQASRYDPDFVENTKAPTARKKKEAEVTPEATVEA